MSAFQHRPERLDAVGVRHAVDVLADRVLHRLVRVGNALVSRCVVGVNRGIRRSIVGDEVLQHALVRTLDHAGVDLVGCPILRADDRHHVHRAAARRRLAFGVRHVLALPADIGFVKLNRPVERPRAIAAPGFPDTVENEPRRRLRYTDVAFQLHRRNRLEGGQAQVDRDPPLPKRDFRPLHGGARLDAEVGPAIRAPIGHLGMAGFTGAERSAFGAVATVRPDHRFKPLRGGFLARKQVHQLDDGKSFAVRFSGCFLRHFRYPFRHFEYRDWGR